MSTLVFRAVRMFGVVLAAVAVVGVVHVSAATTQGSIVGKIEAVNYLSNGAMSITGWACAYGRVDAAAVAAHAGSADGALLSAAWAVMPGSTSLIGNCGLESNTSVGRNYHQYKLYVPSGTAAAQKGKTLFVTASYTGTSSITTGTLEHSGEYGVNGSGTSTGSVIDTQTPTLTLSSNHTTVAMGDSVTLTWTSTHATACIATEGWDGTKGTSGTETVFAMTQNETFTLTCTGTGGTVIKSVVVSVTGGGGSGGEPTPTVTIDADPAVVVSGGETIISWSSTDATTCTASGGWSGVRDVNGAEMVSNIAASSTTFTITCGGAGGTKAASVTVTTEDTSAAPTVTLSANPTTVHAGSSTVLTWSSSHANSCTASGGWTGTKNTSGTEVVVQVAAYTTFTITCAGGGGEKSASVSVSVSGQSTSTPTITLSADPTRVRSGSSTVMTWSTTNATSCVAEGDWTGSRGTSGHETITNITSVKTFTLTCRGTGGVESKTVTVAVSDSTQKLSLVVSPTSVASGGTVTLLWTSSGVTSCTASGDWNGTRGTRGTTTISSVTSARTYTLTCSGVGGTLTKSVTVTVSGQGTTGSTLSFSASQTTVARGGATTLSWSATNVTSCMAASGWSGYKPIRGTETIANITSSLTFKLACIGPGGMVSKDVVVTVSGQTTGGPTVTLTASPTAVASGGAATLAWSSTGATSCTASGDWNGTKGTSGTEVRSSIGANKTYTLSCTGTGGTVTKTVAVTVSGSNTTPTLTISASPTTVASGGSVTLSWTGTNVTTCLASDGWSGTKTVTGTQIISGVTTNKLFKLACTGSGGTVTREVSVSVSGQATSPTVTVAANPTTVATGGSATLTWSSTGATSCTASGGWTGTRGVSGTEVISSITSTKTFTLTCTGTGGTAVQSATVTVSGTTGGPTLTLTANPTAVSSGGNATLSWSSTGATSCTASGDWTGTKGTSGTETVSNITTAKTFTLTCTGNGGTVARTASVTVSTGGTYAISMLSAGSVSPQEFTDGHTAVISGHFDDEQLWELPFLENARTIVLGATPLTPAHQTVLANHPAYFKNIYTSPWGVVSESEFTTTYRDILWRMNNITLAAIKAKIEPTIASADVTRIVTHNPWGEYGHFQHRLIYQAVTDLAHQYSKDVWVSAVTSNLTTSGTATYGQANIGSLPYVNAQYNATVFSDLRKTFLDQDALLTASGSLLRTWTWLNGTNDYPTGQQKYVKVMNSGQLLDLAPFANTLKSISSYNGPFHLGALVGVAQTVFSGSTISACTGPRPSDGTSYNGGINIPMSCSAALQPTCAAGTTPVLFGGATTNQSTNTEKAYACLVNGAGATLPPAYDKGEIRGYAVVTELNSTASSCAGANGSAAIAPMSCSGTTPQCAAGFRLVETGRLQTSATQRERYYACERTDGAYPTTYRRGSLYGYATILQSTTGALSACTAPGGTQSPIVCSSNNILCESGFRRVRLGVLTEDSSGAQKVISCERME